MDHYLKKFLYLYCLRCGSPDVLVVLSRMQNVDARSVRLVVEVATCGCCFIVAPDFALFYLSEVSHFVVIYV